MIRAASVFPIAASIVWERVSDVAFSTGVVAGIAAGTAVQLWAVPGLDGTSTLSRTVVLLTFVTVLAAAAAVTMGGALAFPFIRWRTTLPLSGVVGIAVPLAQVHDFPGLPVYPALASTLVALGTGNGDVCRHQPGA